jgi:MFS transporter, DHA1 family, multidrug resistance protein
MDERTGRTTPMLRRSSRSLDEEEMHETGGDWPESPRDSGSTARVDSQVVDPDEVNWDGPDDPANPQNWPIARKWRLTILSATLTITVYAIISHCLIMSRTLTVVLGA